MQTAKGASLAERAAVRRVLDDVRAVLDRQELDRQELEAIEATDRASRPAPWTCAADALAAITRARRHGTADQWRPTHDQLTPHERTPAGQACRVLSCGVDSLTLTWAVELLPEVLAGLEGLQRLAQRDPAPVEVAHHAMRWRISPHGARPHWSYILAGPWCTVRVRRNAPANQATLAIDVRAAWLARDGVDGAVAGVEALVRHWTGRQELPSAQVARLDLAVDWQGWAPTGHELPAGAFVSRAVSRAVYTAAERIPAEVDTDWMTDEEQADARRERLVGESDADHGQDAAYWRGRRFTGYRFGAGAMLARAYNKRLELEVSAKGWLPAVWMQADGYDEAAPVWRLEFQMRTAGLRALVSSRHVPGTAPMRDGPIPARLLAARASWPHIRSILDGLWARLTGRGSTPGGAMRWATRARASAAEHLACPADRRWAEAWIDWQAGGADDGPEPKPRLFQANPGRCRSWRATARQLGEAPRDGQAGAWLSLRVPPTDPAWPAGRAPDRNVTRWPVAKPWRELAATRWPGYDETRVTRSVPTHTPSEASIEAAIRRVAEVRAEVQRRETTATPTLDDAIAAAIDREAIYQDGADGAPFINLDALARVFSGPELLQWWGRGPSSPTDAHPGAELADAATRAARLRAQTLGVLAAYLSARLQANGDPLPATDAEARAALIAQLDRDLTERGTSLPSLLRTATARSSLAGLHAYALTQTVGLRH